MEVTVELYAEEGMPTLLLRGVRFIIMKQKTMKEARLNMEHLQIVIF